MWIKYVRIWIKVHSKKVTHEHPILLHYINLPVLPVIKRDVTRPNNSVPSKCHNSEKVMMFFYFIIFYCTEGNNGTIDAVGTGNTGRKQHEE